MADRGFVLEQGAPSALLAAFQAWRPMRLQRLALLGVFSLLAVGAQTLVSASSSLDGEGNTLVRARVLFASPRSGEAAVHGAPYSAEEELEVIGPDGGRLESGLPMRRLYRDGLGRTRVEYSLYLGPGIATTPRIVEIYDAVAGYRYTLNAQDKIAHRVRQSETEAAAVAIVAREAPAAVARMEGIGTARAESPTAALAVDEPLVATRPDGSPQGPIAERLQGRTMEGLLAEGMRYTTFIPASGAAGGLLTSVSEVWYSRELGHALSTRLLDVSRGQRITTLKNIRRAVPPAELFEVPPDYAIRDEPAQFSVEFVLPN